MRIHIGLGGESAAASRMNVRVLIIVGALLLTAGALFLSQHAAEAQLPFGQFIVAILLGLRNSFANSPFFGFLVGIFDALIRAFGGIVSG